MAPYFVMVGVPALLAVAFQCIQMNNKRKADQVVIDSFFLIWLILLVFRSIDVGIDLIVYEWHFTQYPLLTWLEIIDGILNGEFEAGYVLLSKLTSYFTDDFRWLLIICTFISVIPIWFMYRKEGQNGFLTIALFLCISPFVMYFSGLRQAMAMAFVAPCYKYCKEKKIWLFLLMVFLAYLFHRSSLMLLFMFPVYHLRLKKQIHILYLLPLVALVYLFNKPIFAALLLIMGDMYADAAVIQSTGAYAVTLLLAIILLYTFLIPDQEKLDDDTVGLRNILILSTFLQIFSAVNTIAMRFNYYYLLLIPLLVSKVIRCGNEKYSLLIRISVVCMTVFFTFYYFYNAYTGEDILQIYPYEFFFQQAPTMY